MTEWRHFVTRDKHDCLELGGAKDKVFGEIWPRHRHLVESGRIQDGQCSSDFNECRQHEHCGLTFKRCWRKGFDAETNIDPRELWDSEVASIPGVVKHKWFNNDKKHCFQLRGEPVLKDTRHRD